MNPAPKAGGRRGVYSATAAAGVLFVAGVLVIIIGLGPATTPSHSGERATAAEPAKVDRPKQPARSKQPDRPKQPARSEPRRTTGENSGKNSGKRGDFGSVLSRSAPVALTIPRIGVAADKIVNLGLAEDGTIEVPKDHAAPGWFGPGPAPGQFGPAVLAGHVDSLTGPAVFYRLSELRAGDRVKVTREDGSVATFVINRVATYDKDEFPTRAVYGTTSRAALRLITCSGEFDDENGYHSNTVAFAHLV